MTTTTVTPDIRPLPLPHVPAGVKRGNLTIRPARREEMNHIAEMVSSSADWYRPIVDEKDMAEHDVDEAWEERNFKLREFHIGSNGGADVGTISLQRFGDWAYLGYIYLFVEHVGKGYGQILMDFAAERAEAMGVKGLCLIAHPDATWAKKAYLKFGFEITETDRAKVLAWNEGALAPYYEEGFELYQLPFADRARATG